MKNYCRSFCNRKQLKRILVFNNRSAKNYYKKCEEIILYLGLNKIFISIQAVIISKD